MTPARLAELRARYAYLPDVPTSGSPLAACAPVVSGVVLSAEQWCHLRADLVEMLNALGAEREE